MKAIQLKKTTIEVPFLNDEGKEVLKLTFDRSQENISRFESTFDELQKTAKDIEKKGDEATWADTETFIKQAMDSMLGEGAYDKVYQLSPSIHIVMTYFYQIVIGIKEELEAEDLKAIESKYAK